MPIPISDWKHPAIIGVMRALLLREAVLGVQPIKGHALPAEIVDFHPDLHDSMPDQEKLVYAAVNENRPKPQAIYVEGGEDLISPWRLKGQRHLVPPERGNE